MLQYEFFCYSNYTFYLPLPPCHPALLGADLYEDLFDPAYHPLDELPHAYGHFAGLSPLSNGDAFFGAVNLSSLSGFVGFLSDFLAGLSNLFNVFSLVSPASDQYLHAIGGLLDLVGLTLSCLGLSVFDTDGLPVDLYG